MKEQTTEYYVYVYIDPRNFEEFYYGKGKASRKDAHLNEYLRFETYVGQLTKVNNSGVKLDISATYTTELRFKDGKVRYEIIELDMTADNGGRNVYWKGSIWKGYPIFNNKDELRLEETKTDLENYFNAQVNTMSDFLNDKKSKKDDW